MNISYDTQDLWAKDKDHIMHAWTDLQKVREKGSLVIAESEGIYVYDSDGNKMIDGPAGMWCVNVGYGRQEIADSIADQAMRMTYFSPFHQMTSPPTAELGAKLAEMAPGDLNEVFFSTGGSEAVDSAIRFVWFYHRFRGKETKRHIISRVGAVCCELVSAINSLFNRENTGKFFVVRGFEGFPLLGEWRKCWLFRTNSLLQLTGN